MENIGFIFPLAVIGVFKMTSVKISDSREKKLAWLNDMLESDTWMTKNVYLPQIIEMGKEIDPEMTELASDLLARLWGSDN